MARSLRIGNMSASRGDRGSALAELLAAGAVDVVAVDMLSDQAVVQLAEELAAGEPGYESALLEQLDGARYRVGSHPDDGPSLRVVTNAGALDPEGLAARVREWAEAVGVDLEVAWLDPGVLDPGVLDPGVLEGAGPAAGIDSGGVGPGMDRAVAIVRHGAHAIATALHAGADVVITGRVSREALVMGAAADFHGWQPGELDALAGSLAVGHVLSGGPGATGVTAGSTDVGRSADPVTGGYPLAEIAADGSAVITKHPSALGSVTVGTVTDQLLDGVAGPEYVAPDVVLRLDSLRVEQEGTDRVRISGARGEAPPPTLPVVVVGRVGDGLHREVGVVDRSTVRAGATLADGTRLPVAEVPVVVASRPSSRPETPARGGAPGGRPKRAPLGSVAGVRFGVVGADVNLGVWTWDDFAYAWLRQVFGPELLAELLPETAAVAATRYELPNLRAVNVVLSGADRDALGADLGSRLSAAVLEIPSELLEVDP